MSSTFTKLFSSITESTIWFEPDTTRLVWITLLAMADQNGHVDGSVPGLAHRARVTVEACEAALATLLAPDKYSRTPDKDGRRIEPVSGGWCLLNYLKYREVAGNRHDRGMNSDLDRIGKVYLIRCGDAIKIGFSQNPWARLNSLKTGMPEEPVLVGYCSATMREERECHTRFEHLKVRREWYRDCRELLNYFSALPSWTVAIGSGGSDATDELPELQQEAEAEAEKSKNPPTPPVGGLCEFSWDRFVEYRKQIRKPIKPASMLAAQRKLAGFGFDQLAVVEQTIANGWTGLFELDRGKNDGRRNGSPRDERNATERQVDELLGR